MVKVVIHSKGVGTCTFSGKEDVAGFVVSFEDGLLKESFVSEGSFLKFVRMRAPLRQPQHVACPNGEEAHE